MLVAQYVSGADLVAHICAHALSSLPAQSDRRYPFMPPRCLSCQTDGRISLSFPSMSLIIPQIPPFLDIIPPSFLPSFPLPHSLTQCPTHPPPCSPGRRRPAAARPSPPRQARSPRLPPGPRWFSTSAPLRGGSRPLQGRRERRGGVQQRILLPQCEARQRILLRIPYKGRLPPCLPPCILPPRRPPPRQQLARL